MSGDFFEDDDYDGARDRYLGGGCHALALAVHERTGWDLAVVWVARGRRTELAHALAIAPGEDELYLDVGGVRGLPEILDDLGIDPEDEEATVEEGSVRGRGVNSRTALAGIGVAIGPCG